MYHASAKPEIVLTERPGQRIRELNLMTEYVRLSRLPDGERYGPAPRVSCRQDLRLPQRHRIAVQVSKSRFVQKMRAEDRCVIGLKGPRSPGIVPGDTW